MISFFISFTTRMEFTGLPFTSYYTILTTYGRSTSSCHLVEFDFGQQGALGGQQAAQDPVNAQPAV